MSAQVAHHSARFSSHAAAMPLPQRGATSFPIRPAGLSTAAIWLERLAAWAERQPMHHRMGSYTALL
jgi:hypothetical protein